MTAGVLARAPALVVGAREIEPDVDARRVAGGGGLDEVVAGADDEHPRRLRRDAELRGDLLVSHPLELAHEQRVALLVGQLGEVAEQHAQRVAATERVDGVRRGRGRRLGRALCVERRVASAAQHVDGTVAGHAIEPRLERQLALVAARERGMRADEDVLHDVLGIVARAAQELGRVAAQCALVALDDRGERVLAARARGGDELRIAAAEEGAAMRGLGGLEVMLRAHRER